MFRLIFFLKQIALTFVVVAILQIKIGDKTAESHFMNFAFNSPLVEPLREVADSGVKYINIGWNKLKSLVEGKMNLKQKESTSRIKLEWERSKEYFKEKAHKTKGVIEQEWDNYSSTPIPSQNKKLDSSIVNTIEESENSNSY